MKKNQHLKISLGLKQDRLAEVSALFEKLFQPEELHSAPALKAYKLSNNDLLELHGPWSPNMDFFFPKNISLVAFPVKDISIAVNDIQAAGFRLLSEVIHIREAYSFCYVELEEELVISIYQNYTSLD